jgi:SEC-C motif-containing protein
MRSRYAAFAIPNGDYLWETTLPNKRKFHHKTELENWGKENTWTKLEIIQSSEKEVEFKAYFTDKFGKENIHHEFSTFKKWIKNGIMFREVFRLKQTFFFFCLKT